MKCLKMVGATLMAVPLFCSMALAQMKLPEAFNELPLFPEAEIVETVSTKGNVSVTFSAEATVDEVLEFFGKELRDQGWAKIMESLEGETGVINYIKEYDSLALAILGAGDGRVSFTLILTKQ